MKAKKKLRSNRVASNDLLGRYKKALQKIARTGCIQSQYEKEYWCKKDGSAHSNLCPAGIALNALRSNGVFSGAPTGASAGKQG